VEAGGDWRRDAWVVRRLWRALARGGVERGLTPGGRDDLMAALLSARDRLRRQLLSAEGVDPEPPGPDPR
jgi:hypothetical protein